MTERCGGCNRLFPIHLIQELAQGPPLSYTRQCPICALAQINRESGLPATAPFRGKAAKALHAEAVAYLAGTGRGMR